MDTTKRMKLSEFAKLNGITYKTAQKMFHEGSIVGIQIKPSGTILVERWRDDASETTD